MSVLATNSTSAYSSSNYSTCSSCNNSTSQKINRKEEASGTTDLSSLQPAKKDTPSVADKVFSILFRRNSSSPPRPTLDASVNENKEVEVSTEDGYTIRFSGKMQEWTITTPDNTTTRIWGDPHVEESDGDKWDFSKQSSFVFGNNKITVETIEAGNGAYYSKTVSIYNGEDRFTLTGVDTNKLELVDWTFDAETHDAELDDGEVYHFEKEDSGGELWRKEEE